ncbi:hypothetical protein ARMGADRAFT_323623 [Armillaria gallica]|uniref:Uncharacterized protein n=1 Tax=Armillaria gallica TaxID=47427 RepID=A0A2H3D2K2_ARMGA|nr:hypothetical protein ARMGADRAFT_323623 [Armillaria gallica]
MARQLKIFLSLSAAFLGNFTLSDDLSAGENWPGQPYWFPNPPGAPPAPASLNNSTPVFTFRAYQPPQTQNSHTNWPQPYTYQPFSQPPPFRFTQVPQPMYYGGFPPQSGPEPVQVDAPDTGEDIRMGIESPTHRHPADLEMLPARSMHQPSNVIAGSSQDQDVHNEPVPQCSQWRSPSPHCDVQRRMMEDIDEEPVSSPHDWKGKGKVSCQQLDWDHEVDDYHCQRDEYRENEREVERARQRAE